jgi:hypothetical protein
MQEYIHIYIYIPYYQLALAFAPIYLSTYTPSTNHLESQLSSPLFRLPYSALKAVE